jgi:hypothetical protein
MQTRGHENDIATRPHSKLKTALAVLIGGSGCIMLVVFAGLLVSSMLPGAALVIVMAVGSVLILVGLGGGGLGLIAVRQLRAPAAALWTKRISVAFFAVCLLADCFGLYGFWIQPSQKRSAWRKHLKQDWLQARREQLDEHKAHKLANELLHCIKLNGAPANEDALTAGNCWGLTSVQASAPAPTIPDAPELDAGWRWRLVREGTSWRLVIEPTSILARSGPLFELDSDFKLFRRDSATAPAEPVSLEPPPVSR